MALETLANCAVIDGFNVIRSKPYDMSWEAFDTLRKEFPILITEKENMVSFRIQKGPIKEVGVNGCQVDTLICTACLIIAAFNDRYPCVENEGVIRKLGEALQLLKDRKTNRESRGVEGTSQI